MRTSLTVSVCYLHAGRKNSSQCLVVSRNQDEPAEELSCCNIPYYGKH